jgi:hypothetical protein
MRTWVLRNPDAAHDLIAFLKENAGAAAADKKPLTVTVDTYKTVRSNDQNRLFHAILKGIAEQAVIDGKQYEQDVWKEIIRCKFIGTEEINLPDGLRIERGISTKTLSVGDFSNLIEIVRAWAATDLNIEV